MNAKESLNYANKLISKKKNTILIFLSGMAFANLLFFRKTLNYCNSRMEELEENLNQMKIAIKKEENKI